MAETRVQIRPGSQSFVGVVHPFLRNPCRGERCSSAADVCGIVGDRSISLPPLDVARLPSAPIKCLRRGFFAAVVVNLCLPTYYMVHLPGIPWIELRRVFLLPVVLLTLYIFAVSKDERQSVSRILDSHRALRFCLIGFIVMGAISIFVSRNPSLSISKFSEIGLTWYMPFLAFLLVVRSGVEAERFYKFLAVLSIPVLLLGVADFIVQRNLALLIIPQGLLSKMMDDSPIIAALVTSSPFRNGWYRAASIYNSPLSFGEFAAMVAPFGAYFVLHGKKITTRALGLFQLFCAVAGIFASGSRGGYLGLLFGMPTLGALYVVRYIRANPRSMLAPLVAVGFLLGLFAVGGLFMASHRASMVVSSTGNGQSVDNGRGEQFHMAIPYIVANPVTGYGLGTAADVIGWVTPSGMESIDSYALSVIVETGVPGFLFYFGMIAIGAIVAAKIYIRDDDPHAEISGPLAASLLAYGSYRFFLAQRENQTLFFIMLSMSFVSAYASKRRRGATVEAVRGAIG